MSIILLTLLIGIIQFAIWFWGYQAGSHAAREGARFAAVDPCDIAAIQTRANERVDELAPSTGAASSTVSHTPVTGYKVGDEVTVEVSFPIFDIGLIPGFPTTVTKAATSRIENIPVGCAP